MTSIKGLEPFPRSYSPDVPADEIPYLEDLRRACNAVRVLRRRGQPTSAAAYRAQEAGKAYQAFLDQKQHAFDNPGLF